MDKAIEILKAGVRPIGAYAFIIGINLGFIVKLISVEVYVPIAMSVIAYYYGQRKSNEETPPTS
ncbi:MAG: hypothetical protein ACYS8Y_12830 [Planctomycetota bacterium]